MKKQLSIVGILIFIFLVLDQAIKLYIKSNFIPGEEVSVLGNWFKITYTENQGMAFGAALGKTIWHKLFLSIFRLIAIILIGFYIYRESKKNTKLEFLIAIGLIFTGATGNLLDSMFHDFLYTFDPCHQFNWMDGSGIIETCNGNPIPVRHHGFMLGSVVDMFQFDFTWPKWVPMFGGTEVFPAIWNLADACISIGVGMIIVRQKHYFPKKHKSQEEIAEN